MTEDELNGRMMVFQQDLLSQQKRIMEATERSADANQRIADALDKMVALAAEE